MNRARFFMTHNHHHPASHNHKGDSHRQLFFSFIITFGFMATEAVGGWLTNSLALLSDAGHMLTDSCALGLSLFAMRIGQKPPSVTKTFGYRRFEVLAALLNGLALWAIVGVILHEAYHRLKTPQDVKALGMIIIAALGLIVNLISMKLLYTHKDENLNIRGAFLHILADSLGSAGALGAGFIILYSGWHLVDPLVSIGICSLILLSSWGLIRDSIHVLLLGVPPHISYRDIEKAILELKGVCCLYDLHIFTIASGHDAVSAHVVIPDGYGSQKELLQEIVRILKDKFSIEHATIQLEESHEMKENRSGTVCLVDTGGNSCSYHPPESGRRKGK